MKKYLVIGNPIAHSLSPKLHNYWYKKNNINAIYEKKELDEEHLKDLFLKIKKNQINGINVTVPFKNKIIPFLDKLTVEADKTQSVNTIYLDNDQIIGHNTDIIGFQKSIKDIKFNLTGKKILILGAGGVVPSIIFALNKMNAPNIIVSNRTKDKAIKLKSFFKNLTIVEWGEIPDFDMIINATSVGLKNDKLDLDFSNTKTDKLFYDVIYNPEETEFLKTGKSYGNKTENGGKMFIHQAAAAFEIWHGVKPEINDEITELLY
jgi:shikimate dehydrogenase